MKLLSLLSVFMLISNTGFSDHNNHLPGFVDVYRFYRNYKNHFFTRNYQEGIQKGYHFERTLTLYDRPFTPNQVPLYRCYVPRADMVFTTTDHYCEGQVRQGLLGYVSAQQQSPDEVPLYRYYKVGDNQHMDHLSTIDPQAEQLWGWQYEGVQGYVPGFTN